MKLLLISLLVFPLTSAATCETELSYFSTSVYVFDKVKKIYDIDKKLFALNRLTKAELDKSLVRLENSAGLVVKTEKLYKECQHKDMI